MNADRFEFEVECEQDELFALAFDGFGNEPQPSLRFVIDEETGEPDYVLTADEFAAYAAREDAAYCSQFEPETAPLAPISPLSGVCVECGGHWVTCPCEPF